MFLMFCTSVAIYNRDKMLYDDEKHEANKQVSAVLKLERCGADVGFFFFL